MASGSDTTAVRGLIDKLVEVRQKDTLFGDLYLARARELLAPILAEQDYRSLRRRAPEAERLLAQVQKAVQRGDWEQVKDLSSQADDLQGMLRSRADDLSLGETVYDAAQVVVDPFSPGLTGFAGTARSALAGQRDRAVELLEALAKTDPEWAGAYKARRDRLAGLDLPAAGSETQEKVTQIDDIGRLQQDARAAAQRGDVAAVRRLTDRLLALREKQPAPAAKEETRPEVATPELQSTVSTEPFPADAIEKGRSLGLEQVQMVTEFSSMPTAVAEFLQRYAWQPEVKAEEAAKDGVVHLRERLKDADLPKETAEPLFEMLALLALHPYVTSAGTRYLSSGVGEFVLLETFPEEEKAPAEESPLLKALELPRRSALSRLEIEEALLRRGIKVVREQLGLDPQVFRLVLVPPDVYTRVGFQKGWGKQQRWTHVDGYQVVRGGRLRALVAGDVRYGGIFDLCSLGSDDERDRVVARFAVVRRERMAPRI